MTDIWTTAYLAGLASPEDTLPFIPPSRAFTAQTVRQAVRLGRGGTSVRLVLSNEFGHAPLVIDEVAVSDNDARAVLPALHHGGARWEIPAGQTATSDPVPLTIGAGEELQVSCYLSGNTEPATFRTPRSGPARSRPATNSASTNSRTPNGSPPSTGSLRS
jgi:hypothetical protein